MVVCLAGLGEGNEDVAKQALLLYNQLVVFAVAACFVVCTKRNLAAGPTTGATAQRL